jgi:protein-tyrosine phosphatase
MPSAAPHNGRRRILVVCSSNACRSPFVAHALQRSLGDAEWHVVSAGTHARSDEPASEHACAAAAEHGVDLSLHRSRKVTRELIRSSELVIAVSRHQVGDLMEMDTGARRRIRLLSGFHPLPDAWGLSGVQRTALDAEEVLDPAEEDLEGHRNCCRQLTDAVTELSRFIARREASRRARERKPPLSPQPLPSLWPADEAR